jgi:hypothetical protein
MPNPIFFFKPIWNAAMVVPVDRASPSFVKTDETAKRLSTVQQPLVHLWLLQRPSELAGSS